MSAPVIAAAINPVDIDPGIAYTYVVPVTGETSMAYTPDANFTLALAGRVLTATYVGPPVVVLTTLPVVISASNSDGTTTQTINFRVNISSASSALSFSFVADGSTLDVDFGSAIGDLLVPYERIKWGTQIVWVTAITGTKFHIQLTVGTDTGTVLPPAGTHAFTILPANSTFTKVWVGSTAGLIVGQPIKLSITAGTLPTNISSATMYVAAILDSVHITVAATAGGAEVAAGADATVVVGSSQIVRTYSGAGARVIPKITSGSFVSVNAADAIDETLTADISFDESFVFGLPTGLSLASNHITGSVAAAGYYPIVLELRKGSLLSKRYLVLTVAAVSTPPPPPPDPSPESSLSGRRVALSLQSGLVMESASARRNVNPLAVALGDGPLVVDIVDGAIQPAGSTHGTLQFGAKVSLGGSGSTVDWDGAFIVFGSIDITAVVAVGTQQTLVPNEDWSADELVALFDAEQDIIRLGAQFRWRNGDTPAGKWYRSRPFQVSVSDTIFRSDLVSSLSALFVQRKPFAALTGGGDDKLDGALTTRLAIDTWLAYVVRTISGLRSASKWFLVAWDTTTAAADETTSGDRGIVIPVDFDATTNAKMWVRVDGL